EHGGTMQSRVLHNLSLGLLRLDCAVLRGNFRGSGTSEGRSTSGGGEIEDYRAALDAPAARYPAIPIWAVGHSLGTFVAITAGGQGASGGLLAGIGLLGEDYDYEIVSKTDKPTFIIQGEADERCALKAVRRFYAELSEPRELIVIDGADHAFDGHASELADAI